MNVNFDGPANRAERVLGVLLAISLIALGVAIFFAVRDEPAFDPIRFEPQRIQRVDPETGVVVVPTVKGFDGIPAIRVGEQVPSIGVRCNSAGREVRAVGSVYWERVDQRGARITVVEDFPATIEDGCVPLRFENDIPDELIEDLGDRAQQWRLAGSTRPVVPNGVEAPWTTESFWIVP